MARFPLHYPLIDAPAAAPFRELIAGWSVRWDHYRHLDFPDDDDVVALSSERMQKAAGRAYKAYRDQLFAPVSESFGPGRMKAWRLRPGAARTIQGWIPQLRPSPPGDDALSVEINSSALADIIDDAARPQHTRMLCRAIAARVWATEAGTSVLYERYHRPKTSRRQFVTGPGLQQVSAELRRLLLGGRGYVHVDIVNAFPSILSETFPDLHALAAYCGDRQRILTGLAVELGVANEDVKELLLMVAQGASLTARDRAVASWARRCQARWPPPDFVVHFAREAAEARKRLMPLLDRNGSPLRTFACFLQKIEDDLLQACEEFHRERGEEIVVRLFDGYVVRTSSTSFVRELETYVRWRVGPVRYKADEL